VEEGIRNFCQCCRHCSLRAWQAHISGNKKGIKMVSGVLGDGCDIFSVMDLLSAVRPCLRIEFVDDTKLGQHMKCKWLLIKKTLNIPDWVIHFAPFCRPHRQVSGDSLAAVSSTVI
jgi:hypothetical protein